MNLDDHLSDLIDQTCNALECDDQVALGEILAVLRELAEARGLSYHKANLASAASYHETLLATRFELTS